MIILYKSVKENKETLVNGQIRKKTMVRKNNLQWKKSNIIRTPFFYLQVKGVKPNNSWLYKDIKMNTH